MKQGVNERIVGIIGGGQLGKMMMLEGRKWGLKFIVLDPQADCPAASLADEVIVADFYDQEQLARLAEKSQVVTYEFEHIHSGLLQELVQQGHEIYPAPSVLAMIQDKEKQKEFLRSLGIPVANFCPIDSLEALQALAKDWGLPLLLKQRFGGYDGKGNFLIQREDQIPEAYQAMGAGAAPLLVEAYVPFVKEISVIGALGNGEVKLFPVAENCHQENILRQTVVPARVSQETEQAALAMAREIIGNLDTRGVICIEMFVLADGSLLVNEMAPRPHNSGHYTIEGCRTSQFQQHLRSILGLPLGDCTLLAPCVMNNLLGEPPYKGPGRLLGDEAALGMPGVYLHYYGKTETKPLRKMGHVNILADSLEAGLSIAEKLMDQVKVVSIQ